MEMEKITAREILRHIDEGANYYVGLFGAAPHMETVRREHYSFIRPKGGEHGVSFVYDIRIDALPCAQQQAIVSEIKALNMPYWVDLLSSDSVFRLFFGRDKIHGQTELSENDEVYMAMLPRELPEYPEDGIRVERARSAGDFCTWANIANGVLAGGRPDVHPVYHYPLCRKGLLKCYTAFDGDVPAAAASIIDKDGVASLEFIATLPQMRRRGFAAAACRRAVREAFSDGARVVTVRAVDGAAARLYDKIGFRAYNCAI